MTTGGYYNPSGTRVVGVNEQIGTTYTPVLSDAGKVVRCTNANPVYVTVPKDVFPLYTVITFEQGGAGNILPIGATDVTVNAVDDNFMSQGQDSQLQIYQRALNIWTCVGGIESDITTTVEPTTTAP